MVIYSIYRCYTIKDKDNLLMNLFGFFLAAFFTFLLCKRTCSLQNKPQRLKPFIFILYSLQNMYSSSDLCIHRNRFLFIKKITFKCTMSNIYNHSIFICLFFTINKSNHVSLPCKFQKYEVMDVMYTQFYDVIYGRCHFYIT